MTEQEFDHLYTQQPKESSMKTKVIVITGEAGSGKTLFLEGVMRHRGSSAAQVHHAGRDWPSIEQEIAHRAAEGVGVLCFDDCSGRLIDALEAFPRKGGKHLSVTIYAAAEA